MAKGANNDLAVIISANTDPLSVGLRAAAREMAVFNRTINQNSDIANARAMARELAARKKQARDMAEEHKRAAKEAREAWEKSLTGRTLSFTKMFAANFAAGAALRGVDGLASVFGQIPNSVKMAADLERTAISFEVMLKSGERATDMIQGLRKFAAETPFGSAETITAAKQLMAYGVAAADVIPTLRMLGNITAPIQDDTTLREMAYLYGTLAAQQRAYTKDLNQFANRGIPIFRQLALELGVDSDRVREFAEEGRISFSHVGRALESLQLKGGLFAGMLDKQAKSLHGLWEQAADAFDRTKIAFGQMLIEELDLKGVVRDLKEFAENLAAGADMRGLRQGIRLAGDFGKSLAHVGYEFGRAAFQSADVFAEMASQTEVFRDTLLDVRNIIRGLNEFRLDPVDVAKFAVSMTKDILAQGGAMVILVAEIGDAFEKNVIAPIMEGVKFLRDTARELNINRKAVEETIDALKPWNILREAGDNFGRRWGFVEAGPQSKLMSGPTTPAGMQDAVRGTFQGMKDFGDALKKLTDSLDRSGDAIIRRLEDRKRIEQLDKQALALQARRRELVGVLSLTRGLREGAVGSVAGLGMAGDPMAGVVASAAAFRREFQKGNAFAAIGGGPMSLLRTGNLGEPRLGFANDLDANLKDLARQLNDEFSPYQRLMRDLDDIAKIEKAELITPGVARQAREKRIGGVADALGIGGRPDLPDSGAERGSEAAVRIMNQFMTGRQARTVEDLLQQIRDLIKEQNREVMQQGRDAARPANVFSPF